MVRGILSLLALAATLATGPAEAHRFEHPKTLRLILTATSARLAVAYDVDPGKPSQQLRALFDRDTSGEIDDAEATALEAYLGRTAMLFFSATLGGKPIVWRPQRATGVAVRGPVELSKSLGYRAILVATVDLTEGGEIHINDRDKDAAKHVPMTIDVPRGLRVALASRGEWAPATRQLQRIRLRRGADLMLRLTPQADLSKASAP